MEKRCVTLIELFEIVKSSLSWKKSDDVRFDFSESKGNVYVYQKHILTSAVVLSIIGAIDGLANVNFLVNKNVEDDDEMVMLVYISEL